MVVSPLFCGRIHSFGRLHLRPCLPVLARFCVFSLVSYNLKKSTGYSMAVLIEAVLLAVLLSAVTTSATADTDWTTRREISAHRGRRFRLQMVGEVKETQAVMPHAAEQRFQSSVRPP